MYSFNNSLSSRVYFKFIYLIIYLFAYDYVHTKVYSINKQIGSLNIKPEKAQCLMIVEWQPH